MCSGLRWVEGSNFGAQGSSSRSGILGQMLSHQDARNMRNSIYSNLGPRVWLRKSRCESRCETLSTVFAASFGFRTCFARPGVLCRRICTTGASWELPIYPPGCYHSDLESTSFQAFRLRGLVDRTSGVQGLRLLTFSGSMFRCGSLVN